MKFLVPLVLAFAGVGAGVGAGVVLRPDTDAAETVSHGGGSHDAPGAHDGTDSRGDAAAAKAATDAHGDGHGAGSAEYVQMRNQFIVPILEDARVDSLVVLAIDLEVAAGQSEAVHRYEPKIRDAFLTVLFDHANTGGFKGNFTSSGAMDMLRVALREAGRKAVGDQVVTDVLITNIIRQDV